MRSFCIEPEKVFHQFHIELLRFKELMGVKVDEFFLDTPIESFAMSIHFRSLRVCVVMLKMKLL